MTRKPFEYGRGFGVCAWPSFGANKLPRDLSTATRLLRVFAQQGVGSPRSECGCEEGLHQASLQLSEENVGLEEQKRSRTTKQTEAFCETIKFRASEIARDWTVSKFKVV